MIDIALRDFRGCERADICCAPIALVAGLNGAGKTSICQAVAAALTSTALPIAGMKKADAAGLVRSGCSNAKIIIVDGDGHIEALWPACTIAAEGQAPHASLIAAGLTNLPEMRADERARALAELLHSDPTREDFVAAMADADFKQTSGAPIWSLIEEQGWDATHALRKEHGAQLKGRWRQIAGQNYGSRVAASWMPEHWTDDLDQQTERELAAAVADAKAAFKRAAIAEGADTAKREALETEVAQQGEREALITAIAVEMTASGEELKRLIAERDVLPATNDQPAPSIPCPECGTPLVVVRSLTEASLERAPVAPPPTDQAQLKRVRLRKAELDGAISGIETKLNAAKRKLSQAQTALERSRAARTELAALPLPDSVAGSAVAAIDAERAITAAERRLAAFAAKEQADSVRDHIVANERLLEILAPDGLRARKLMRVLDVFNSRLADLCSIAGWRPVAVQPDMAVTYGGRIYPLLSASEQYRVRVILQIAAAQIDGSSMLVIDAADILDAPHRSALITMISEAEVPALIAMTLSKREQLPDLAAAEIGISYWIEAGVAKPIGDAAKREAA